MPIFVRTFVLVFSSFLLGILCSNLLVIHTIDHHQIASLLNTESKGLDFFVEKQHVNVNAASSATATTTPSKTTSTTTTTTTPTSSRSIIEKQSSSSITSKKLFGMKILVAIVAFDFRQLPHLEEILDSYHDLCVTGATVHVYVYATVPYPVALIDLLNTRLTCEGLQVTIVLKSPSVKLNLVDYHRTLFYEKIDEYDLFIYTEDDIRVTPKTVMAYVIETKRIEQIVGKSPAEDFNIGIIRYEYNYPENAIINDSTRTITQNVTRVYWEHLGDPIVPKVVNPAPQPELADKYLDMKHKHQGMYMATRELLQAWKDRPKCNFNNVRQRPNYKGKPNQPSEGTQRVWMSSNMLYGRGHCNVQQLLPKDTFGQLNVQHLPNKNYRRIGKKGRLGAHKHENPTENRFGLFGNETFTFGDPLLNKAMDIHLAIRKHFPVNKMANDSITHSYTGIQMIDEVDTKKFFRGRSEYVKLLDVRLEAFSRYVKRGGVLSEEDIEMWKGTGELESFS